MVIHKIYTNPQTQIWISIWWTHLCSFVCTLYAVICISKKLNFGPSAVCGLPLGVADRTQWPPFPLSPSEYSRLVPGSVALLASACSKFKPVYYHPKTCDTPIKEYRTALQVVGPIPVDIVNPIHNCQGYSLYNCLFYQEHLQLDNQA